MRHSFTVDGRSSMDFKVWCAGSGAFDSAAPDVSTVKVPGRNGELIYFNNRFNNVKVTYDCFMLKRFNEGFTDLAAYLYSDLSYRRLEDTYHPDYYRMARISGGLSPKNIIWHNDQGTFKVTFDCMPQKFLRSGEIAKTYTASGNITNPTLFTALPIIRIYGSGTISVGGYSIKATPESGVNYIDVDCEIMEAYSGNINCNKMIEVSGDDFPRLSPGTNRVTIPSTVTEVDITPRWWTV